MRDAREPEREQGDRLEAGQIRDPPAPPPDLLQERERQVRFLVELARRAVVPEQDDADDAENDDDRAEDVGPRDGRADEEVRAV